MSSSEHKNVTEDVVDYLKQKIMDGTWKPGDKISSENELTACLSVSRASVRYAIQHCGWRAGKLSGQGNIC